jgi:superoxide dismutase, Cu-Zn family
MLVRIASVAAALITAGCGGMMGGHGHGSMMGGGYGPQGSRAPDAVAVLEPRSGSAARGSVSFYRMPGHLMATFEVSGLKPGSEQGFHVHEKGDCSAADATSAGGHFNPTGKPHGHHASGERHAGDLPNLRADANGVARGMLHINGLNIGSGTNIVGLSVVVHRDPDDYKSQPAGNSGPRIACGVIRSAA